MQENRLGATRCTDSTSALKSQPHQPSKPEKKQKSRPGATKCTASSPTVQSQPQIVRRAAGVLGEFDRATKPLKDLAASGGRAVEARSPASFIRAQEDLRALIADYVGPASFPVGATGVGAGARARLRVSGGRARGYYSGRVDRTRTVNSGVTTLRVFAFWWPGTSDHGRGTWVKHEHHEHTVEPANPDVFLPRV